MRNSRGAESVCKRGETNAPERLPRARCVTGDERAVQVAVACGAAFVLAVCILVAPDVRGIGTHTRLGLPPCRHIRQHGIPCASCGATTSVCWLVRGRVRRAFDVHPGGAAMGALLILCAPVALLSALMRWRWSPVVGRIGLAGWAAVGAAFLALMLFGWQARIERYLEWQAAHRPAVEQTSAGDRSTGEVAFARTGDGQSIVSGAGR